MLVDAKYVIDGFHKGPRAAHPINGEAWRAFWAAAEQRQGEVRLHKVKSHTGGTSMPELGNEEADRLCKEFAQSWSETTHGQQIDHAARTALAVKVAVLAARALALFPSMRDLAAQVGLKRFVRLPASARPRSRRAPAPLVPAARPHIFIAIPGSANAVRCAAEM